MGFFYDDDVFQSLMARGSSKASSKVKAAPINSGARGCDTCPLKLEWPRITSPRMRMSGALDGDVLVIGEGPGEEEDQRGEVYVGPTGQLLRNHIPGHFIERMAMQNAVRCRPLGNRTPTPREVYACSGHLEDDVAKLPNLKAILGTGAVPLSKFITETSLSNIHGHKFPVQIGERVLWYYPVFHPSYITHMQKDSGEYEPAVMPVFRADMVRFFRELDTWRRPRIAKVAASDVKVPTSLAQAEAIAAQIQDPVGLDLETFSTVLGKVPKPYHKGARVLCAALSDGVTTMAWPIDGPQATTDWGMAFLLHIASTRSWIAHQAGYELAWLLSLCEQYQVGSPELFEDSMALLRLYHQSERLTGLGIGTRIHLGINVKRVVQVDAARITEFPIAETLQYNGLDAYGSAKLWHKLRTEVDDEQYLELLARIESATRMELMGLPVNQLAATKLHEHWGGVAVKAQREATDIYEAREFMRHYSKEMNIASPMEVGIALAEYGKVPLPETAKSRHDRRQYSTDDQIMQQLAPEHPLVKSVLAWREAQKLDGTYIQPMIDIPKGTKDGLLHPSYSVCLVSTYRPSSEDPNAENYPKRKHREIRAPIEAPAGHVFVAVDFGQMQVRNLAMASEDRKLIRHLFEGHDIHTDWLNNLLYMHPDYLNHLADKSGETDEAKVRKAGRDTIKGDFVFNSFFGGGADNVTARTGIPIDITKSLQAELWVEYPGVKQYHRDRRREYSDTGTVRGLTGIVLGRVTKIGNEPINYPIQNAEAEIVWRAQNELSQLSVERGDPYLHPRINVYDDLTFILPIDRLEDYVIEIAHVMLKVRFDWQIVPLVVEVKTGPNWADLTELVVLQGDYSH